jgi:hypothetical protein
MLEFNPDAEYGRAIDRSHTIDAIIALNPMLTRKYLNTQNTDTLHELEDSLLDTLKIFKGG